MKKIKISVLVFALTLFLVGCGLSGGNRTANLSTQPSPSTSPQAAPTTSDKHAFARATFSQTCANCHQAGGEGGVVEMKGKRLKVPSLRTGGAVKDSDKELSDQIANGGDGMPAFKERLSPDQINELVRFIREELQSSPK